MDGVALKIKNRIRFSSVYAFRHLLISVALAFLSSAFVFLLLYPFPYRDLLRVESIFLMILAVDVVCGPLLTLVLGSQKKSFRERVLDFSLVGLIQLLALLYGLHSVWAARPVAVVFEIDRLVVVTANEVQIDALPKAANQFKKLPLWGVFYAGTRKNNSNDEYFASLDLSLEGVSPSMRPNYWIPWGDAKSGIKNHTKPVDYLIHKNPAALAELEKQLHMSLPKLKELVYLPLTSSKTLDWIALFDKELNIVGYAPIDGF